MLPAAALSLLMCSFLLFPVEPQFFPYKRINQSRGEKIARCYIQSRFIMEFE
jgi:hypothetical protein